MSTGKETKMLWLVLLALNACSDIDVDPPRVREASGDQTPSVATRPRSPDTLPEPVPVPSSVHVIPAGEVLTFTLLDSLDTDRHAPGQSFRARLSETIESEGQEILPEGSLGEGLVVAIDGMEQEGTVRGFSVTLTHLTFDDRTIEVTTGPFIVREDVDAFLNSGEIDVIAQRPDGSAVGTLIAQDTATGVVASSRQPGISLPQGTRINFVLIEPVAIDSFPGLNHR